MLNLCGRHLVSPSDLALSEIDSIIALAQDMQRQRGNYSELCRGKILATLFYEPSTRTKLSFESAMLRMGGAFSVLAMLTPRL